jgi:hypothetical protein
MRGCENLKMQKTDRYVITNVTKPLCNKKIPVEMKHQTTMDFISDIVTTQTVKTASFSWI